MGSGEADGRRAEPMEALAQTNLKGSVRLGNYLRRLRAGYGYSLRRVEERARAEGGEIDNSQLSRYEKGICYPSFDKLRVLANVFNVSIQAFSDVVDLEEYEDLKPEFGDPREMIVTGNEALRAGDMGRAFAHFERALELLEGEPTGDGWAEQVAQARINLAAALIRLGKLSLAEQELRNALRAGDALSGTLQARALLNLASVHSDQGDLFLAEMEADRAYGIASLASLDLVAARARHVLAGVLAQRKHENEAIERYREAAELYSRCGEAYEVIRVRIGMGLCYVNLGKVREGIRLLRASLDEACVGGHRYLEAYALSCLGEAYYRQKDSLRSHSCLRQSDTLAGTGERRYPDLLFLNAFYEWRIAGGQGNPTREKIAFGRMKALRACVERRFPEVETFDAYVERGRNHA
jgi:transcriptional regulator with XRE-family HTH domain